MTSSTARLESLDGLRGVAAVVVMLYHLSLVARPFLDTGREGDVWWWLTETPLKVFTAGTEAVLVFFVLSGVVVVLPALRSGFSWGAYYVSRPLRLYLPVWGSLGFAALLVALVPRDVASVTEGSWLDNASAHTLSIPQLLSEATLFRASYDLNNVLWSLRWEVVFSLALPLFVVVGVAVKRHWLVAATVATAVTVTGRLVDIDALVYLPVFFLGVLVAVRLPELRHWASRRSNRTWLSLTALSLTLLIASWLFRPLESVIGAHVLWGLAALGAVGLIVLAIGSPLVSGMLSAPLPRWLGRVSFSLYLVQAPVIGTLGFALGDRHWPLVIAVGIPACLLVAWLFNLVIERPSHALARSIKGRAERVSSIAR